MVVKSSASTTPAGQQILTATEMAADNWKTLEQRVDWVLARKPELENQSVWAKAAGIPSAISSGKSRERAIWPQPWRPNLVPWK